MISLSAMGLFSIFEPLSVAPYTSRNLLFGASHLGLFYFIFVVFRDFFIVFFPFFFVLSFFDYFVCLLVYLSPSLLFVVAFE